MKIFMSHSSRQKLLVKELRHHLPQCMTLWIDEFELLAGTSVEDELREAVSQKCDYFIVLIDENSVTSGWVDKEINWALDRERALGRPFLLPVILEKEALPRISSPEIANRKHLVLSDFTDPSIRALAQSITSETLQWLSQYYSSSQQINADSAPIDTRAEFLARADKIQEEIAEKIKVEVHPFRESNPLNLQSLAIHLHSTQSLDSPSSANLIELLDRLSSSHLLNGVEYGEDFIYLSQEQYSYKSSIHTGIKKRMAARAARTVTSGITIAIDGGSTTLELARSLTKRIRQNRLRDLTVITNSIPVAHEIANALSEIGVMDRDHVAQIHLTGGMIRPVSLTIVPNDLTDYHADFERALETVGKIDIAFLGANGVHQECAFANHSSYEIPFKQTMTTHAARKIMLVDPSKFSIEQERPFAYFSDGLEIVTAASPESVDIISRYQDIIKNTSSTLEVLQ